SGYIPRGNSDSSAAMDGTNPLSGINQRTLTLSNGEVIWDIAGNVYDWTDATILGKDEPKGVANPSGFGWYEYSNLYSYGTFSPERLLPLNPSWNSTQGYGRIYTSGVATDLSTYSFLRGGRWGRESFAGVLALALDNAPSVAALGLGFRCAR
ncbi:MAG TPA: hypothetical protein PKI58_01305, partial [bacterium]|nr:hypothetical protein [bacterium]